MFYEPKSDFFYDPKIKLYYGNNAKKYFRYARSGYPPFVPVASNGADDTTTSLQPENVHGLLSSTSRNDSPETVRTTGGGLHRVGHGGSSRGQRSRSASREISIKINTTRKLTTNDKPKTTTQTEFLLDKNRKEQLGHIAKWQAQKAQPIKKPTSPTHTSDDSVPVVSDTSATTGRLPPPIRLGDKAICTLCRRKFPDMDTLARHNKLSKLHQDNLAKQETSLAQENPTSVDVTVTDGTSSSDNAKPNQDKVRYVDRAEKRRRLHAASPEYLFSKWNKPMQDGFVRDGQSNDFLVPDSLVGGQNIGNQIFQKMAAKSSDNDDNHDSVSQRRLKKQDAISFSRDGLVKEWSRIETISGGLDPTRRMALQQMEKWGLGSL
jgi:hypothetical protein